MAKISRLDHIDDFEATGTITTERTLAIIAVTKRKSHGCIATEFNPCIGVALPRALDHFVPYWNVFVGVNCATSTVERLIRRYVFLFHVTRTLEVSESTYTAVLSTTEAKPAPH